MSPDAPESLPFADDGTFPNSRLPALLYRRAFAPSADADRLMAAHGWTNSWRNGIYPYTHYHSTSHEALAIVAGSATVQLGGRRGDWCGRESTAQRENVYRKVRTRDEDQNRRAKSGDDVQHRANVNLI